MKTYIPCNGITIERKKSTRIQTKNSSSEVSSKTALIEEIAAKNMSPPLITASASNVQKCSYPNDNGIDKNQSAVAAHQKAVTTLKSVVRDFVNKTIIKKTSKK